MFKKLWKRIRANRTVYFFLLPSVIVMLLIVGYPLLNTIYYSLTDMTDETFSMDSPVGQKRNTIAVQELGVVVPSLTRVVEAQKKVVNALAQGTGPAIPAAYHAAVKARTALIKKEKEKEVTTEEGLYSFGTYYDLNLEKLIEAKPPAGATRSALLAFEKNILSGATGLLPRLEKESRTLADKKKKHPTRFIGLKNLAWTLGLQDTPLEAQEKKSTASLVVTLTTAARKASGITAGDPMALKAYDTWLLGTLKKNPAQAEILYRYFSKRPQSLTPSKGGPAAREHLVSAIRKMLAVRDTLNTAAYSYGNRLKDTFFILATRIKRTIETVPNKNVILLKNKNNELKKLFRQTFTGDTAGKYTETLKTGLTADMFLSFKTTRYGETLSSENSRMSLLQNAASSLQTNANRTPFQEKAFRFTLSALSNRQTVLAILAPLNPEKRTVPDSLRWYLARNKKKIAPIMKNMLKETPLLREYLLLRYGSQAITPLPLLQGKTLKAALDFEEANYKTVSEIRGDHSSGFGFWDIFFQTIIWTIVNVFMHFSIGLYLAHWLNKRLKGNTVYRAFLMIPWTVPTFVAAFSWRLIFDLDGLLNRLIEALGGTAQNFMGDQWVLTACIIVNIWVGVPFMMITLLGGLQTIPGEQYEAAEIDGANAFQKLMKVTLPGLKPVASVAVLLGFIWTFNMFNIIYLVTLGIEMKEKNILVTYAYDAFQKQFNYAESATYGVIILSLLLAFGSVYTRMLKKGGEV